MEFEKEYKKLNKAQREAVDSIDGPVMVVAGPGTGKTQILALRIGNILLKTDTKADGVLCLTFTNSAVEAMKNRLAEYIGEASLEVNIFTFHSFGMKIIESYYQVLQFPTVPKLLDDADTAILFDEILNENEWKYLRPRADTSRYFSDLRSLISLLKRERITGEFFLSEIEKEIESKAGDPENISTRGESKGELKKEVLSKLEGLERSREVVKFFDLYEKAKKEKNKENVLLDYDDVLENLVKIAEVSSDARADIQEKYLYVLVDEHQDSSRVQNEFLKLIWGKVENPNIFVVGDDRQLIYGFSGASIDHFAGFKKTFKGAKLITLVDNYRSTQVILDASHALLPSVMTDEKLVSQNKEHHPIRIFEAEYSEDEIATAALDIKEKIKKGLKLNDCAILVPKNAQVRDALEILHQEGLAVSSLDALNLFDQAEGSALFRVLKAISDSSDLGDSSSLAFSFFDKTSLIAALEAHTYLSGQNMREFSLDNISNNPQTLFGGGNAVQKWIEKLYKWKKDTENSDLVKLVEIIGRELLLESKSDGRLVSGKEILSTVLALVSKEVEKNPNLTLPQFLSFIDRLESYGEHIPVILEEKDGVKVLTLHSSKGLEFDYVWIAHMNEHSLNSGKKMGFVLPEAISKRVEDQDIDKVKRKLYVAITRAKRFCTLSYAVYSSKDAEQEVAKVIRDLPEEVLERHQQQKVKNKKEKVKTLKNSQISELVKSVADIYKERYISVSLLNNFFECPWKWYFRNLLKLPEEKSESLEFGSAVHEAIDKILKLGKVILPEDKEVAKVVKFWAENRLKNIAEKRENEKSISVKDNKFPHLNIYGKIDLVEYLSKDELRVTDFKTGSVRKKGDIEKIDEEGRMSSNLRQLAMYSYLLENASKMNVRESRLEFLEAKNEKDAFYDRVITQKEIDLLVQDITDYDNLIKEGKWINRPCNYNSYGKNTECEYCKMAKIYTDL